MDKNGFIFYLFEGTCNKLPGILGATFTRYLNQVPVAALNSAVLL
jgi:hypothetical protein